MFQALLTRVKQPLPIHLFKVFQGTKATYRRLCDALDDVSSSQEQHCAVPGGRGRAGTPSASAQRLRGDSVTRRCRYAVSSAATIPSSGLFHRDGARSRRAAGFGRPEELLLGRLTLSGARSRIQCAHSGTSPGTAGRSRLTCCSWAERTVGHTAGGFGRGRGRLDLQRSIARDNKRSDSRTPP